MNYGFTALVFVSALMVSALGNTAPAKGRNPVDFEGSYKLVRTNIGYCEQTINIYRMNQDDAEYINMFVGSYFFTNVNGGKTTWKDDFESRESLAYTTADSLLQTDHVYNKAVAQRTTTNQGVRLLKNGVIRLFSRNSEFPGLPTECTYKKVVETETPQP